MASMDDLISGEVTVDDLREIVSRLHLYEVSKHSFHDMSDGPLGFVDLPIYPISPNLPLIKCVVEKIMDIPGPVPKQTIKEILSSTEDLSQLPHPYGLRKPSPCPCKLDLAIIQQTNDEKYAVCKMISFKEKMKVSELQDLFFGQLNAVDWKNNVKHMKKCMYLLFQALGGFQCRHHELRSHEEGKPDVERSEEEWNVGFDFIEEYGPRENVKNRQLRWITIQISTSSSPIYKWPAVLVEKSLRNLSNDGVLAQVHENWPLTLFDLDNRFLKVLAPLVPSLVDKALGFHGVPGAGKTPAARTIAMAISRMWLKKMGKADVAPSFRQACEFDFFRGQTGSVLRPDIFDDGSFSEQPFKKVKAFTDIGNVESMSKERWGAAKWVKGQLRIYCCNDFEGRNEPKDDMPIMAKRAGEISFVRHEDFMKMLEPAWYTKEATEANIMAVLKRTHIIVNTHTFLYVRPAGEDVQPVLRVPLGDKTDFLAEPSRPVYDFYRKGGSSTPANMQEKLAWEEKWMTAALNGKKGDELPRRPLILGPSLFGDRPSSADAAAGQDIYSSQHVNTVLAHSASPLALPSLVCSRPKASTASASTSNLQAANIGKQNSFAVTLRASTDTIEISDSPVRPQKQQKLMKVKTEIEEKDTALDTTSKPDLGLNNSQGDMAEETESVVNDATMLADMEGPGGEESLEKDLEKLMDEEEIMDEMEVPDVAEPRE